MGRIPGGIPISLAVVVGLYATSAGAADNKTNWDYGDASGPEIWGELSEDFADCKHGTRQSPVNLADNVPTEFEEIDIRWEHTSWSVSHTGYTIQIQAEEAGTLAIVGKTYKLRNLHFHTPSEHAIDGKHFAIEAHFVHANPDGPLAVIGVMLEPGGKNDLFGAIMSAAPKKKGNADLGKLNVIKLLPEKRTFMHYQGSLTTPPCTESVHWIVMAEPVLVSDSDISVFKALFPMNARPLQTLHRREVQGN